MDPEAIDGVDRIEHGSSDEPGLIDFSANVNPETPDGVATVYQAALESAGTYPTRGYPAFRRAAAAAVDCDPAQVVPTAGAMGAIRLTVEATVSAGDTVLLPTPSFGEYAREVQLQGATPALVDHGDLPDADPAGHALVVTCTPNNPTGLAHPPDELRTFARRCRAAGTPLLVDEAFLGFTDLPSLAGEPGVVVARSLTKLYGLPGLRAGYAVTSGDLLDRLQTAVQPWALGTPAAAVGAHCLRQPAFVDETRERVRRERARLRDRLGARFDVHHSDAPFLLLDVGVEPGPVVERARASGVALRDATTFYGLDTHVRVAVRTREDNDRLLEALDVTG